MENMEKGKLNSEMIWKIWKISVLVIITPKETSSSLPPPPPAATTTAVLLLLLRRCRSSSSNSVEIPPKTRKTKTKRNTL
jgi:hypothetical protein